MRWALLVEEAEVWRSYTAGPGSHCQEVEEVGFDPQMVSTKVQDLTDHVVLTSWQLDRLHVARALPIVLQNPFPGSRMDLVSIPSL